MTLSMELTELSATLILGIIEFSIPEGMSTEDELTSVIHPQHLSHLMAAISVEGMGIPKFMEVCPNSDEIVAQHEVPSVSRLPAIFELCRTARKKYDAVCKLVNAIDDIESKDILRKRSAEIHISNALLGIQDNQSVAVPIDMCDAKAQAKCEVSNMVQTGTILDEWCLLGGGQVGVIMSMPGCGKSTTMVDLSVSTAKNGPDDGVVVFFSEEMSAPLVAPKFYRRIVMSNNYKIADVVEQANIYPSRVIIECHARCTSNISFLENRVSDICHKLGKKPITILVDYVGVLKNTKPDRYESMNDNICGLARMASVFACPVWTAAQPQRAPAKMSRSSVDDNPPVLDMFDIGECWAIPQVVDYLVSLNQTLDERAKGIARLFKAKVRIPISAANPASVMKVSIDYALCKLSKAQV